MSHTPKESDRCEFIYSSGRRCRMIKVAPEAQLCFHHWEREQVEDAAAKSAGQIISDDAPLDTPEGIHKALGNVFRLFARNRIPARNAAILGYIGQTMLANCPTYERMLRPLWDQALLMSKLALNHHKIDKMNKEESAHDLIMQEIARFERFAEVVNDYAALTPEQRQTITDAAVRFDKRHSGEKVNQAVPAPPSAPAADASAPQPDSSAQPAPQPVSTEHAHV